MKQCQWSIVKYLRFIENAVNVKHEETFVAAVQFPHCGTNNGISYLKSKWEKNTIISLLLLPTHTQLISEIILLPLNVTAKCCKHYITEHVCKSVRGEKMQLFRIANTPTVKFIERLQLVILLYIFNHTRVVWLLHRAALRGNAGAVSAYVCWLSFLNNSSSLVENGLNNESAAQRHWRSSL